MFYTVSLITKKRKKFKPEKMEREERQGRSGMPRAVEMKKTRSRNGCNQCRKVYKIKCDEAKPRCGNCASRDVSCDYTVLLKWNNSTLAIGGDRVVRLASVKKKAKKSKLKPNPQGHGDRPVLQLGLTERDTLDPQSKRAVSEIPPLDETHSAALVRTAQGTEDGEEEEPYPSASLLSLSATNEAYLPELDESVRHMIKNTWNSSYYELYDFFVNVTSLLFVPAMPEVYESNPFSCILPKMALESPSLMNLLIAFSATHKNNLLDKLALANNFFKSGGKTKNEDVHHLLSLTIKHLLGSLDDCAESVSDNTLATFLLLASFDIFFNEKIKIWRSHIDSAKSIILRTSKTMTIKDSPTYSRGVFLLGWLNYMDITSSLCSAPAPSSSLSTATGVDMSPRESVDSSDSFVSLSPENTATSTLHSSTSSLPAKPMFLKYTYTTEDLHTKRLELTDISYFTGMDIKILSYLNKIVNLIKTKEYESKFSNLLTHSTMSKSLEISYDLENYLEFSEQVRDTVIDTYYKNLPKSSPILSNYKTLRATNKMYVFTGLLQLKRRILELPSTSRQVKNILLQMGTILKNGIPMGSPAAACLVFGMFCSGCELIDDPELISLRGIYIAHIQKLQDSGISSSYQAIQIMTQCWKEKKPWWVLLKEKNIDITFAI